ncbi:MAG: hydrogenase formation protein HypD [Desulfovibrio sp.]|nr:hydrogenase formation protein HypD [Desulfovibrio sp.]
MQTLETARAQIAAYAGPSLTIMEVCGTHTHEIFRLGLRQILPKNVHLVSGPGCPVCVTPPSYIDEALALAAMDNVTIATFGDLLRIPGSHGSLRTAREHGATIRLVYSPLDALEMAKEQPEREIVFLSVGFETTVPGACAAVLAAHEQGIPNFSLLTANKTMPKAYEALMDNVDCYLYPGHVCAITGTAVCEELLAKGVSGVVAGFTMHELVTAMAVILHHAQNKKPFFVNAYPRVVRPEGNREAQALIARCMEAVASEWRGLGVIPDSGLALKQEFAAMDARKRFALPPMQSHTNPRCRCGDILRGAANPHDCPLFDKACTPDHPVGACMVSSEGTCAAYYHYFH